MIRRTLLNRARRQRDLARTLIARHSLMAYDHGQLQQGYRLASSSDAFFAFGSSDEPAAPMFDQAAPYRDELAVPLSAWAELPANLEPAVEIAPSGYSADHPPAATQEFIAPFDTGPDAPAIEIASQANAIQDNAPRPVDLGRSAAPASEMMIAPGPAQAAAGVANQISGNTLADLVRRMRGADWVAPEAAAPAMPAPAAAAAEPIANEQIADLVRQIQQPPQPSTPRAERRRIPLGQRMSEATDFGQPPTPSRHTDPIAAPAHAERPAEAADHQPAVFETDHPAAERSDSAVAHFPAPTATIEPAGWQPIVAGVDTEAVARTITSEAPQSTAVHPDATMATPGAPLEKAEPPIVPRALSQVSQLDTHPAMTTALPPAQAPDLEIVDRLQNLDAPMALPVLATSDLRAPADIPPVMMNELARPAAATDQVDQIDAASRQETPTLPELRQSIKMPTSALSDAAPQFAEAAFADAEPATVPAAPNRSAAATPASQSQPMASSPAQASLEIHEIYSAMTDPPQQIADNAPAPIAAESDIEQAHLSAKTTWPVKLESQRSSSLPAPDTAGTRSSLLDSAQEGQAPFGQPGSSSSQMQSSPIPPQSAKPVVLLDDPTSSASVASAAESYPLGGAQMPSAERASAPVSAAESTTLAPEHISPKAWAAPLPLPDRPIPAPTADTMHPASEPNAAQQSASNFPSAVEHQVDAHNTVPLFSTHEPANESDRTGQSVRAYAESLNLPAQEVEAHVSQSAPAQPELVPALSQQLRTPRPDDTAAGIAPSDKDMSFTSKSTEAPIARSGELAQEARALSAADDLDATHVAHHRAVIATAFDEPTVGPSSMSTEALIPPLQVDDRRNSPEARYQSPVQTPNNPGPIALDHTPAPTTAVTFDRELRSALPRPDQRSSIIYDVPAAAHDITAADPLVPGSPQAWAARFARHRQLTEPQPEPASIRASTMPIIQPAAAAMDADAAATPAHGSPQAWATRFAQHRQLTEPQLEPAAPAPTLLTNQSMSQTALAVDMDAESTVAPGSPQAWAMRFARHRQLTEPQPESIAVRTPAAPDRLAAMVADPAPGTPARFIPARQVDLGAAPAPVDTHAAATKRSPIVHDAATTVDDVPAVAVLAHGSPQAWAARFARHRQITEAQVEPISIGASEKHLNQPTLLPALPHHAPDNQPQIALRHAAPTPIAETTRRFLRPLVGIDPAEVRVFRGPAAGNVTAAYRADALASGDMVALAAQHGEDSPATLGVLAHELTHIARQRDARFVPPLTRRENMAGAANEESLAQSVEAQVRRIARGQDEATRRTPAPLDATLGRDTPPSAPAATPMEPRPAAHDPRPIAHDDDWGGLPAPWEPLPQWFDAPKLAEMPAHAVTAPMRSAPPAPPAASRNGAPSAPAVQLAETGRMLDAPPAQSTPAPAPTQQPAPDLDALARQVYAVLKQRLAAERRRSQS